MSTTAQRVKAMEAAAKGTGWATPLFCAERPSDAQLAELADNARRGIRQLIFIGAGDTCWLNSAGPWCA